MSTPVPGLRLGGKHFISFSMLAFLAFWGFWSVYQHGPPSAAPADAPETAFSAERAHQRIRTFAREPHPSGSEANAKVRDYLADSIGSMGLSPEIQVTLVNWRPGRAATTENVLARIDGTANTRAVALVAHYDSVAFGPGAADDGSGVAALLETLRALKAGPPLKNDVMFLFVDGEEGRLHGGTGLRGARAFVQQHPWAKEIGVVLNFDARGTSGPSYVYETSPENGWLIAQLARAGCKPMGASFMYDLYSRTPLASDFTVFRDAGIPGLNFAFIKGLTRYHTMLDCPENVSLRSLQHDGEYALKLARHFGDLPLEDVNAPNAVYFNTLGYHLVHYPLGWALPLAILVFIAFVALLAFGFARGTLTPSGVLRGFFAVLAWTLIVGVITGLVVYVGYRVRREYILYSGDALTLALLAFTLGVAVLVTDAFGTRAKVADLAFGAALWWALLMVGSAGFLPSAAYLYTWPLAFALVGFVALLARGEPPASSRSHTVVLAVSAVPGIVLIGGNLYALHTALPGISAPIAMILLTLLLALLTPQMRIATAHWPRGVALVCGLVALAFLLKAAFWSGFDAQHPKLNCLTYALNADTGNAFWLSNDDALDEWTGQFFPGETTRQSVQEFLPEEEAKHLKASAPPVALAAPSIELLADEVQGDIRRVRLQVDSPRHAPRLHLYADPETRVHAASVDGQALLPVEGSWFLAYGIFPRKGIQLTLDVAPGRPIRLRAIDHSYRLPDVPGHPIPERPDWMIVKPNTVDFNRGHLKSNETLVAKTYVF